MEISFRMGQFSRLCVAAFTVFVAVDVDAGSFFANENAVAALSVFAANAAAATPSAAVGNLARSAATIAACLASTLARSVAAVVVLAASLPRSAATIAACIAATSSGAGGGAGAAGRDNAALRLRLACWRFSCHPYFMTP